MSYFESPIDIEEIVQRFKKGRAMLETKGITLIGLALGSCIYCIPNSLTKEEALKLIREHAPSGTSGNWEFTSDPTNGPPPCSDLPDHTHYVLVEMCLPLRKV